MINPYTLLRYSIKSFKMGMHAAVIFNSEENIGCKNEGIDKIKMRTSLVETIFMTLG